MDSHSVNDNKTLCLKAELPAPLAVQLHAAPPHLLMVMTIVVLLVVVVLLLLAVHVAPAARAESMMLLSLSLEPRLCGAG